jgi:phage-related protein
MGTAIGSVQDAYKGLAKSNATMLDNLKLGYGGNQGELARLLNDSGVLGDVVADEKNVWDVASFDKIIDAIGVIQERLGMMGVSQEEALHTIQGSISMTRAAWQNLITGWANPDADLESLTDNLMVSLDALQDNAVPAIQRILKSMGTAVVKFAPAFRERLTSLITDTAPDLLEGAGELLSQLGGVILDTLPTLVTTASTALSKLLSRAMSTIRSNSSEIRAGARALVTSLFDGLRQLVAAGDINGVASTVTDTLIDVLGIVADNASDIIGVLFDVIHTVISTALARVKDDPQGFVQAVGEIIGAIVGGFVGLAGELAPQIGEALTVLLSQGLGVVDVASLGERVQATLGELFGVDLSVETVADFCTRAVNALANGLAPAIETAIPTVSAFMASLAETFTSEENLTAFTDAAGRILGAVCDGIKTAAENGDVATFRTSVVSAVTHFVEWLTDEEQLEKLQGAGLALLGGLADGLGEDTQSLVDAAGTAVDNIVSHLTSDWNLSKIIDGVLTILANIALGVYNGLVDIVTGGIEWIADKANSLFFGGDEQNAENLKADLANAKDFWHADYLGKDDIYKGFRNMERAAGLVSEADWAESMKDYNEEAAQLYRDRKRAEMANWDLKGTDYSLADLNINQTVEIDGDPVSRTVETYKTALTARRGY